MPNRIEFIASAKKIAKYMEDNGWKYSQKNNGRDWKTAAKNKNSNCSNYTCLALQDIGALKPKMMFYSGDDNKIHYITTYYSSAKIKAQLTKYCTIIKVGGKKWKDWKKNAKPGDINCWHFHTSIYIGKDSKGDLWGDAGRTSTTTKTIGGKFKNVIRHRNMDNQKVYYVIRLKDVGTTKPVVKPTVPSTSSPTPATKPAATTVKYYKKYIGSSLKVDTVLSAIGVPSKYRGSVEKRKPLAKANSISGYKGTAAQNLNLINKAKKGKLKKV